MVLNELCGINCVVLEAGGCFMLACSISRLMSASLALLRQALRGGTKSHPFDCRGKIRPESFTKRSTVRQHWANCPQTNRQLRETGDSRMSTSGLSLYTGFSPHSYHLEIHDNNFIAIFISIGGGGMPTIKSISTLVCLFFDKLITHKIWVKGGGGRVCTLKCATRTITLKCQWTGDQMTAWTKDARGLTSFPGIRLDHIMCVSLTQYQLYILQYRCYREYRDTPYWDNISCISIQPNNIYII